MTDEKKIEEQAPEQGEEKVEAVVLDENVLEQLLVGCIWDVLRRMHRVATKAITPTRQPRRTMPLRVTSPARSWVRIPASRARFRSSVPRSSRSCASFPTMPRTSSPRRSTVQSARRHGLRVPHLPARHLRHGPHADEGR